MFLRWKNVICKIKFLNPFLSKNRSFDNLWIISKWVGNIVTIYLLIFRFYILWDSIKGVIQSQYAYLTLFLWIGLCAHLSSFFSTGRLTLNLPAGCSPPSSPFFRSLAGSAYKPICNCYTELFQRNTFLDFGSATKHKE